MKNLPEEKHSHYRMGFYNFQYPIIWNNNPTDSGIMQFDVFGPKGTWKIISSKGLEKISLKKVHYLQNLKRAKLNLQLQIYKLLQNSLAILIQINLVEENSHKNRNDSFLLNFSTH